MRSQSTAGLYQLKKKKEEVVNAMRGILSSGRTLTNLHPDNGKEFFYKHF